VRKRAYAPPAHARCYEHSHDILTKALAALDPNPGFDSGRRLGSDQEASSPDVSERAASRHDRQRRPFDQGGEGM